MTNSIRESHSSSWHGKLDLNYQKQGNTTKLTKFYAQSPFKVQRPFYPEDSSICHSVILHTAGGIVSGDRLSTKINLESQSKALITTSAANKIYRSKEKLAHQQVDINIENDAHLEFLPQETIVFNGAKYQQKIKVNLEKNSTYLNWEIIRFGRTARGEKFIDGDWKSYTEIWQQNKPIWIDNQWQAGNEETFFSPNGLQGKPVVGTLIWVGNSVDAQTINQVRNLWQQKNENADFGATQLMSGLLCRYRGNSTAEVKNWFIKVWQLLRQNYHQNSQANFQPRIWQL